MFISIVPQGHCRIIERFGKPVKVQRSGLVFRIPILDQVKKVPVKWGQLTHKGEYLIELTEQFLDTTPRECFTRDNAKVLADCILRWRIIDPIKAVYEVDNLMSSLINGALNAMRAEIGGLDLDVVLSARQALTERIVAELSTTTIRWGVQIISVEIKELKTDDTTSRAMLQQMEAERRSRAIASEAEGEAKAIVARAEAERNANILKAEGVSQALHTIAEAERSYLEALSATIGKEAAARILLAQKTLDGFAVIASKPGDKVYIPSNVSGFVNMGDSIK